MSMFGRLALVSAAALTALLVLFGSATQVLAAPPTPEEIRAAIEAGVDKLIEMQQEDGSWKEPDVAHGGGGYDVGRSALATLALLHAQRHVKSDKVVPAIHKGLTFLVQQWPEPKTYTAGLVQQALYKADPRRYSKWISMYGWMTVRGQMVYGPQAGCFSYGIYPFPKDFDKAKNYEPARSTVSGRGDNSNTQFGVLALLFSEKAGFQVPKVCWLRMYKYWVAAQHQDGGWDYQSDAFRDTAGADAKGGAVKAAVAQRSYWNMTCAGTVSTAISNEMLNAGQHDQCKGMTGNEPVERGLDWIAKNFKDGSGLAPYGWYACERLGILMGYSEFGGTDWYEAGSTRLVGPVSKGGTAANMPDLAFGILFLSRGLEPIIFNKLKRQGEWNLHLHDISHATDYISEKGQLAKQWRIVTLNASVDYLLRVPILYISGHEKLMFTDDEKKKLKEYVERGGTILGEACCSKKEFDESFRALMAELWPEGRLQPLPATHLIYETPRPLKECRPEIQAMGIAANQGRLGVLYLPHGISCQWERGNVKAYPAMDVAWNIFTYVNHYFSKGKSADDLARERVASHEGTAMPPPAESPSAPDVTTPAPAPDPKPDTPATPTPAPDVKPDTPAAPAAPAPDVKPDVPATPATPAPEAKPETPAAPAPGVFAPPAKPETKPEAKPETPAAPAPAGDAPKAG